MARAAPQGYGRASVAESQESDIERR
jgi:hypothetical protein